MHSFTFITTALSLASLASSSPVPAPAAVGGPSTRTFTVYQNASKPVFKNGPLALANTYNKYKKPMPAAVSKAAAAAADGSVTTTPEPNDEEYLTPVTIGGQTLNLDFDTGSADLWVFSSELSASLRSGHPYYTPSKSKTSKLLSGATWSISYGDQSSASGNVYTDTVSVGATTVTGQAVEAAEQISTQFQQDTNNDGLLGLAFSSINTVSPTPQNTFFDNAKATLQSPVFTADLKKGAPGTYDFGFIDSSKYTGAITYASVNTAQGLWEFTGSGYQVGSSSFKKLSIDGIMDTGTTLLLLPDAVVNAYYDQINDAQYDNSQGGYTFSCSDDLPDLTLGIGSGRFVVPGSYINFTPTDSSGQTCFGGLQSNSGIGISIYGDIFIKSQFVIFDGSSSPSLGVASKSL